MSESIVVVVSTWLLQELRNKRKVTHHYLENIEGKYSAANISEAERLPSISTEASNNNSEAVHEMSTRNMQIFGTIRVDSCAADELCHLLFCWTKDLMLFARSQLVV